MLNRFTTNNFKLKQCYLFMCRKQNVFLKSKPSVTLPAYLNVTKFYQLFLYGKYPIINYPDPKSLLNKVLEIISNSPDQQKSHEIKTLLQESWFKRIGFNNGKFQRHLAETSFYGIILLGQIF